MAKASWVSVTPTTGSGSKTVNVSSAAPYTGRAVRTTVLTVKAANVESKTVTVNQAGKASFVDSQDTATANKVGQTVTISGVSNSQRLTFTLGVGTLNVTLPTTYIAASMVTQNGAAIDGDPGAVEQYAWSIVFNVAENTNIVEKSRQIIVTDSGGNTDICTLTQAAGDPYLRVSVNTIELTPAGTPVSFEVESNTSWTIS